jgi:hypothetical protein
MTNANLRSTIQTMATEFAAGILNAIRSTPLEDILRETGGGSTRSISGASRGGRSHSGHSAGKGGRLARRSAEDISAMVDRIVALLARKPKGLRAEQIRDELSLEAKELPRPIAEALRSRKVTKSGQKRATTYFAKGAGAPARGGRRKGTRRASAKSRKTSKAGKGKKRGNSLHVMNGAATS